MQFVFTCPLASTSPDGKWTLIQTRAEGEHESYSVHVTGPDGREVGEVAGLNDAMPFLLRWSSRSGWFAVDHHVGSFLDTPEVYEVTPGGVVRRDAFRHAAQALAHRMYPCLPPDGDKIWVTGSIFRWSRDGQRLAWAFTTRTDMCLPPDYQGAVRPEWQWQSFLMISDVGRGNVVPGSVRVLAGDKPFADVELPTDGPYATF